MQSIRLIDRDTDISKLKIHKMYWDTVINGEPYFVVLIEGYIHTIGGKYGNNNLWAYPRNEKPSFKNLIQFDGEPVCLGINYAPYNHARYRHGEFEARTIGNVFITRNGEKFCDVINKVAELKYNAVKVTLDVDTTGIKDAVTGKLKEIDAGQMTSIADGMKQFSDSLRAMGNVNYKASGLNAIINSISRFTGDNYLYLHYHRANRLCSE